MYLSWKPRSRRPQAYPREGQMPRFPFLMSPYRSTPRARRPDFSSCRLTLSNSSSVNNDLNRHKNLVIKYRRTGLVPIRPSAALRKAGDRLTIATRFRAFWGVREGEFSRKLNV